MEPDPLPEPKVVDHSAETKITTKDINTILGVSKRSRKPALYLFSKRVIILVASVTTFVYFSFHYFGML